MILAVILLTIITGVLLPVLPFQSKKQRDLFNEIIVVINTIMVWYLILNRPADPFTVVNYTGDLSITFKIDGLGMVFGGLVATLWPLATLYAFEYMTKEERESVFFMFYTMTYGVTLGIAFAGNLLTMYFFYELLTLVTVPLVMHTLTREAILASRKYLYYSLGGAAFAFIGMIFVIIYGDTLSFTYGGVLNLAKIGDRTNILLLIYVMAFMGFGVKAAICPFNSWLPEAGVAPTPVTALLHAVAVVKSGAFATMRLTYYCFGVDFLRGTWAQKLLMAIVLITILYGSGQALRETHIKRRLAFSTISNLSYILFGVVIMTPLGLVGALSHMVFHAVMKIASFFCAGAIMHETERNYIHELDGLGYKMPGVFTVFTFSSLALMGVPGLCGFISKWNLAQTAVSSGNAEAYIGIAVLMVSALLTAIYMMTISIRAFFPGKEFDYSTISDVEDPNWMMILPLVIFVIAMFVFGLYSEPVIAMLESIAAVMN